MNTVWFVAVVLFITITQSFLYRKYVSRVLKVKRSFSTQNAVPGDIVTLNISIINRSILPITWMHIEEAVPAELGFKNDNTSRHHNNVEYIHSVVISLLPLQRVNRRYSVEFTKRGYYELKDVDIRITDILGDNSQIYTLHAPADIVVYPRFADMSDSFMPARSMQGDVSVKRWIIDDPTMFIGHKEYVSGDSFKSINWKRTAKEGRLMVNKYDYTSDRKFMLLLDLDELGYIWSKDNREVIEKAVEACAFLAESLISQGIPVGFATNALYGGSRDNGILEPGTGDNQKMEILDCLGRIQYFKREEFAELLGLAEKEAVWGTEFIIVVPFVTDGLMARIKHMNDKGTTVIAMAACDMQLIPENLNVYVYREAGDANAAV